VDAIFRQWQAERPDIDPAPVRIYGLIAQIQMQSTGFIDEVLAPLGLVGGTIDVLTALRRAGDPYRLSPKHVWTAPWMQGRFGCDDAAVGSGHVSGLLLRCA
jgi:hypothetical protein